MAEEEEEEVINDAAIITAACLCQVLRHTRQITSPFSVSNVTNETKLVLRVQLKGNTALKNGFTCKDGERRGRRQVRGGKDNRGEGEKVT